MYYSKTTNGFYDEAFKAEYEAVGTWPADAVEITDAVHDELMAAQKIGSMIQADASGNPVAVAPAGPTLAELQANASNQIDAAAGQARGKYVTVTSMQSAVYEMKYDEAVAYQAATNPVATDYPHLNAEATQTNTPIATVAANVISTRNAWVQVSAKIEGYRLGGKAEVNAATDADGVQAALTAALANLESC